MKEVAVVRHGRLRPAGANDGQRLVEALGAFLAGHTERLLLVRIGDPEPERRQQPTSRQSIESRQFLRQHHRVATGQHHHAHAELQTCCASGGERHAHQGIGRLSTDALAQPQTVETQGLESVDDPSESLVVQRGANAESVSDANLHERAIDSRRSAVS